MLQARVTAGISYVLRSELALPHLVIRPSLPEPAAPAAAEALLVVLRDEVCMPLPLLHSF